MGSGRPRNQRGQKQKVDPMMEQISNTEFPAVAEKANSITRITQHPGITGRPSGKLGQILKRLERKSGATIDALINLTGWQKHSVHGALSKLRKRGFDIRLEATSKNRTAYRLVLVEA